MTAEEYKELRKKYISIENPEWLEILDLRKKLKEDIEKCACLKFETFEEIISWKLRKQKRRTENHRKDITQEILKIVTSASIKIKHKKSEIEDKMRTNILISIPGVGIGVASAILALYNPKEYGVIDYINWKIIYGNEKRAFTTNDYIKYLKYLRKLAKQFNCDVQDIDYLMWKEGMLTIAST